MLSVVIPLLFCGKICNCITLQYDLSSEYLLLKDNEFKQLKKYKLIEGRRPNIYVSAKVAALTDDKASYIKHRELDKRHYKKLIVDYLLKFGSSARKEIDAFMLDKLSDALSYKQKKDKVRNLLQEMRRDEVIERAGKTSSGARWELSKT